MLPTNVVDAAPVAHSRIYTLSDVAKHASPKDCWCIYDNKVFDVSQFLPDHPGGDDLVLQHAGKDITPFMADENEHTHSQAAYGVLLEHQIGVIGAEEAIVDPDFVLTDAFKPADTHVSADYQRNKFLDLDRPLLMQVWNSNFSKSFYLQQVHQPRHLAYSAKLFSQPWLEVFTLTPWWVVPLIWLPITFALFARSVTQQAALPFSGAVGELHLAQAVARTTVAFLGGNVVWTILEYTLHRFLFHVDDMLPDTPFFLMLHFLLHGIHHYLPMDRLRLVMPPLLFTALSLPFTRLAYKLFPTYMANGVISGAFFFYVGYDCMHYALHHTKLPQHLRNMKKHHMEHHYKTPDLGFGVTSKVWDWVFGTDFV